MRSRNSKGYSCCWRWVRARVLVPLPYGALRALQQIGEAVVNRSRPIAVIPMLPIYTTCQSKRPTGRSARIRGRFCRCHAVDNMIIMGNSLAVTLDCCTLNNEKSVACAHGSSGLSETRWAVRIPSRQLRLHWRNGWIHLYDPKVAPQKNWLMKYLKPRAAFLCMRIVGPSLNPHNETTLPAIYNKISAPTPLVWGWTTR